MSTTVSKNFELKQINEKNSEHVELWKLWHDLLVSVIPASFETHASHSYQINPLIQDSTILLNLCHILQENSAKSMILEFNYVDRSYLQDFQRYHLSCYQHYKKTCLRLHFFNFAWDTLDLTLDSFNSQIENLKRPGSYLGNMVIRPLPTAFIGRVHLTRNNLILDQSNSSRSIKSFLIDPKMTAHLFGLKLSINALVYLQQDRSIGACSPTSLWVSLNALKDKWELGEIPAISQLIEMNTNTYDTGNRSFPNSGLYIPQIEYLIKLFRLEPDYLAPKKIFNRFDEFIYAYLRHSIPVILVLELWQQVQPDSDKTKHNNEYWHFSSSTSPVDGSLYFEQSNISHMCVISGLNTIENEPLSSSDPILYHKNEIISYLIHDDRIGPYQSASITKIQLLDGYSRQKDILKLDYQNSDLKSSQFWSISGLLIPSHPKIRVSYQNAKQLILFFIHSISVVCQSQSKQIRDQIREINAMHSTISDDILNQIMQLGKDKLIFDLSDQLYHKDAVWDFYLSTTNDYKTTILSNQDYPRDPSIRWKMLNDTLPRFIWVCHCSIRKKNNSQSDTSSLNSYSHEWLCDLIIDATDIDPPMIFYRIYHAQKNNSLLAIGERILMDSSIRNQITQNWAKKNTQIDIHSISDLELSELWKNILFQLRDPQSS